MRNLTIGLFAAATLFTGAVRATEPSVAQDRTTLYQREVRAALHERGWTITQDEAGKLTAERRWINRNGTSTFVGADDINRYARLQIDFRADDKNHHVAASARASLCYYQSFRSDQAGGYTLYPPSPLRDPKLTQEYHEILADADAHTAADHHAYGAVASSTSEVASK